MTIGLGSVLLTMLRLLFWQLKMPDAPAKGDTARLKKLAFEFVHNNKMFATKVLVFGVLCQRSSKSVLCSPSSSVTRIRGARLDEKYFAARLGSDMRLRQRRKRNVRLVPR